MLNTALRDKMHMGQGIKPARFREDPDFRKRETNQESVNRRYVPEKELEKVLFIYLSALKVCPWNDFGKDCHGVSINLSPHPQ